MGQVVPFKPRQTSETGLSGGDEQVNDHSRGGARLHAVFDSLAVMENFANGLPRDRLIHAAHHAVDLQDEVNLLDFKEDLTSEETQRLLEMAARLEMMPLADYISGLSVLDAHRTPQRVMAYTSMYIERLPNLLET